MHQCEGSTCIVIVDKMGCCIVGTAAFHTKGYHTALQTGCQFFIVLNFLIDHQHTALGKLFHKKAERTADIVNILEEIQMIFFDIQNGFHSRIEGQKTVGIFTGFCNKAVRFSQMEISMDAVQHTAYGNGGVFLCCHHHFRNHGCGGCFSVGTGYCNCCFVISHNLAQQLCSRQAGNSQTDDLCQFRMVFMDGSGIYHHINLIGVNIGCGLMIGNHCTFRFQLFCQI